MPYPLEWNPIASHPLSTCVFVIDGGDKVGTRWATRHTRSGPSSRGDVRPPPEVSGLCSLGSLSLCLLITDSFKASPRQLTKSSFSSSRRLQSVAPAVFQTYFVVKSLLCGIF